MLKMERGPLPGCNRHHQDSESILCWRIPDDICTSSTIASWGFAFLRGGFSAFFGIFLPRNPGKIIRLDEDICFKRVVPLPTITRVG